MCSPSPLPTVLSVFLLLFAPLFANPPFNRFPNSPSGIYRLGTNTLGDYEKRLRILNENVEALDEEGAPSKKEKELKMAEMLKKNGFKDEAQLKYLQHVVKWEVEKRKNAGKSGEKSLE